MVSINICKATSGRNLKELQKLFRGEEFKSVKVTMTYNVRKGLPREDDVSNWPFEAFLEGTDDTYHVRIFTLTIGYSGAGPTDFERVLKFLKVPYVSEDIFTKKHMDNTGLIKLEFSR